MTKPFENVRYALEANEADSINMTLRPNQMTSIEKAVAQWDISQSEAATNLEFEQAARLRDEIKRLKAVELAVMDDPLARQSAIEHATASWPKPAGRKSGSTGGRAGTRTYRGKGR